MFKDAKEAISWIENIKRKSPRENLNRMKEFMAILSNPEKIYKTIHIAGTNGKGATCEFCSSILENKGYKVGRFVSPYILRFNERIVVNHKEISDSDLLRLTNFIYPIVLDYNKTHNDVIPFFEVVCAIGFLYFKEQECDICVIEAGLGGRLDATNIIDSNVCIIPSIGYDHMKTLGNTLEEISNHKLGIVKEGAHLITGVTPNLYEYFNNYVKSVNASVTFINKDNLNIKTSLLGTRFKYKNVNYFTNLIGEFEALNASLAIEACKCVDCTIDDKLINDTINHIFWPGRMELISTNPLVVLDGGHNISAIDEVVDSIKKLNIDKKITILYTSLFDKDSTSVIKKLEEIASSFVITKIEDTRAEDPYILYNKVSINNKKVIENEFEAYDTIINNLKNDEMLLIIGSLHFVSSLRSYIKK